MIATVGRVAVMADGSLSERQKRAVVAYQFELQMPKYPLRILERLTNYRYRMFDDARQVEELATTLAHSFDFYEYRMNLQRGVELIVCQRHNAALPVWCLELETAMLYKPGTGPNMNRPDRKRRNQNEKQLLISQLILGVDTAHDELLSMEPRTRQRYLDLRQQYLKKRPGRPWVS
jgi:hypothetical protein